MFRRLLTAALFMAALLTDRVTAKPPDLPLPQNDVLAPETHAPKAPPDLFPPSAVPAPEPSLFFRVRPSVRRMMASCLLFGVDPLLALMPTEEYVDFDEDDGPQAAFLGLFTYPVLEEPRNGQPENLIQSFTPANWVRGVDFDPAKPLTNDLNIPIAGQTPEPSVCPWMREQQCDPDRHAVLFADIDLSHDVLDNLEMLRQAHGLLQDAQELGRAGQIRDALDCLEQAHELCPNTWLDETIQEASAEVFACSYCASAQGDDAAASLRPCLPPVDPQVPAVLDDLYPETSDSVQLTAAYDQEREPPASESKDVAKPFVIADHLEEVGCVKDGGAPMACLDVLKAFAALVPPEYGELAIGLDGRVRLFMQVGDGVAVWHLLYDNGILSVWASPDCGAPAENATDDGSGD